MTRLTPKLLTAVFALGCGPAMANTDHGQWTGDGPGYGNMTTQTRTTTSSSPSPDSSNAQQFAPPQTTPVPPLQPVPQATPSSPQAPNAPQAPNEWQDQDDSTNSATTTDADQRRLGVMVMTLTPELQRFFGVPADRGVLIARVEPGSAAERAGIQVGDVLVRVGPRQVRTGDDVVQALAAHTSGRIRVAVVRQGRLQRLTATIPNDPQKTEDQDEL